MSSTAISWTNAVWNPVTGCSHVSAGCFNCYAETWSLRRGWSKKPWTARNAAENVKLHPDRLDTPLRWRKPKMVFVNSMSDLFHELVPDRFIDRAFSVMAAAEWHTFQVLTKRPQRMLDYFKGWQSLSSSQVAGRAANASGAMGLSLGEAAASWDYIRQLPLRNLWLGVSVEDQQNADERIPLLLETPAAVRFLSCEPFLGPIDLEYPTTLFPDGPPMCCSGYQSGIASCGCRGLPVEPPLRMSLSGTRIDWVIAGGESGPDYRRMDVEWARSLKAQCAAAGVPFFMKQDSARLPGQRGRIPDELWVQEFPQTREPVPT